MSFFVPAFVVFCDLYFLDALCENVGCGWETLHLLYSISISCHLLRS